MSTTRRRLLQTLGAAAFGTTLRSFGQGRCRDGYESRGCPLSQAAATAPVPPPFAPTGWKTVALDHIRFRVPDIDQEANFYVALVGWKLRSLDSAVAILDIGNWGSVKLVQDTTQRAATVDGYCWVIEPWDAAKVEQELRKRGLTPVFDSDESGFESFHVKDPDGFDLQIANANGLVKARRKAPDARPSTLPAPPFASTGWRCTWLDHLSYNAANYKAGAAFYTNLLGWKETYDEGSQHELMIGDVGDIIIRGGNPFDPNPAARPRGARIDHISFGIAPWDTDGVKAELEKRGLRARVDTSTVDEIHVAAFKSYHTTTPNNFDLQLSAVAHDTRLTLANAVKPKSLR